MQLLEFAQFILLLNDKLSCLVHGLIVCLGYTLLMVAQDGNLPVAVLVVLDLFLNSVVVSIDFSGSQLVLESDGGVVGSENFSR